MKVLEKDMRMILPEAELVLPSMARAKKDRKGLENAKVLSPSLSLQRLVWIEWPSHIDPETDRYKKEYAWVAGPDN